MAAGAGAGPTLSGLRRLYRGRRGKRFGLGKRPDLSVGILVAKRLGSLVPDARLLGVRLDPLRADLLDEGGIVGGADRERRLGAAGFRRALEVGTGAWEISDLHHLAAVLDQLGDTRGVAWARSAPSWDLPRCRASCLRSDHAAVSRDDGDVKRPLTACAGRQGQPQIVGLIGPETPFRVAERTARGEARTSGSPRMVMMLRGGRPSSLSSVMAKAVSLPASVAMASGTLSATDGSSMARLEGSSPAPASRRQPLAALAVAPLVALRPTMACSLRPAEPTAWRCRRRPPPSVRCHAQRAARIKSGEGNDRHKRDKREGQHDQAAGP